ncbi:TrkH family potassium uptake protein [Oscillatoria sp. CS-180]|uniref:TrkH family potassium uptake protein n=1 Tax=Oscillatoria sp. CS-180 TaxID=3021720 RepID=UPI00232F8F3B|nr:TrkH family potassium uptake protein [Oscillatoria sp. CS-180]MDB9525982.1 TrkH family potassium uptake protein [Oscillatoria sp. CS-180]
MTVPRTICAGFLMLVFIGTVLLFLPIATASGQWNDPIVALFTATSAVCVTGLIVVDTGSYYSPVGQGIILLLIQVGGLGYMTATTVLILILRRRLGLKERLAVQQSMDTQRLSETRSLIVSIISMTLIFELAGAFCLVPTMTRDYGNAFGLWSSIFHSVSAFNNAGFSLFEDSLVQYARSTWVNIVITSLVIFGGIGYQVIMEAFMWVRDRLQGSLERTTFSLNFKIVIVTSLTLLVLGTITFLSLEYNNPDTLGPFGFGDKLTAAWFQSVIARTAGFNSIDINAMQDASLFLMIALMFIGASPGSTGGGLKTTTISILFMCTRAVLRGYDEVLVYRREIPPMRILKAISVVVGSGITVVCVTIALALFNPEFNFLRLLFEAVSAFATVGLSTGITADLSTPAQLVIIATMYLGRVGVLLFMAALVGDHSPTMVKYPEEDLLVG